MKEILEAIAALNGWPFDYGRADFQNLTDIEEQKDLTHIFLDPVERNKFKNDTGVTEAIEYSGSFMLLRSSSIDETDYNNRYEKYIKPVIETDLKVIEDSLNCDHEARFRLWKDIEVINIFDYNFDGILVTFQVIIDE